MMSWILWPLVVIAILVLLWRFFIRKAPVIRTYSISGDITLLNDCTGNDGDNPTSIQLIVRLYYKGNAVPTLKILDVPMNPIGNGVTSTGTYTMSGVPTNEIGDKWEIDFPDACSYIICKEGTCANGASVPRLGNITAEATVYNYRYSCSCTN